MFTLTASRGAESKIRCYPFLDPVPLVLQGEGHFVLSSIKNIEVTEQFVGLGQTVTRCQSEEYRVDCEARKYRERVISLCQCSPFHLRSYYGDSRVK